MLDVELPLQGCDRSWRITKSWLADRVDRDQFCLPEQVGSRDPSQRPGSASTLVMQLQFTRGGKTLVVGDSDAVAVVDDRPRVQATPAGAPPFRFPDEDTRASCG